MRGMKMRKFNLKGMFIVLCWVLIITATYSTMINGIFKYCRINIDLLDPILYYGDFIIGCILGISKSRRGFLITYFTIYFAYVIWFHVYVYIDSIYYTIINNHDIGLVFILITLTLGFMIVRILMLLNYLYYYIESKLILDKKQI